LIELGCSAGQGYFFARPVNKNEARLLLKQANLTLLRPGTAPAAENREYFLPAPPKVDLNIKTVPLRRNGSNGNGNRSGANGRPPSKKP
jgi:hypothetical protein